MSQETWNAVDDYFAELFAKPDAALNGALADSAAAGLPPISVTPNFGRLLFLLATLTASRRILEVGTLGGYSTIWLARALGDGGRLVTLEANRKHADVAAANLQRAGLADVVDLRVGPAEETLPQLAQEGAGPFDFIFLDADKASLPEYFAWSLKLSREGSVVVADNVVRNGEVVDAASDDRNVQGVRRFLEIAAAERRVESAALQTVGAKGYDGFAIAIVTKS